MNTVTDQTGPLERHQRHMARVFVMERLASEPVVLAAFQRWFEASGAKANVDRLVQAMEAAAQAANLSSRARLFEEDPAEWPGTCLAALADPDDRTVYHDLITCLDGPGVESDAFVSEHNLSPVLGSLLRDDFKRGVWGYVYGFQIVHVPLDPELRPKAPPFEDRPGESQVERERRINEHLSQVKRQAGEEKPPIMSESEINALKRAADQYVLRRVRGEAVGSQARDDDPKALDSHQQSVSDEVAVIEELLS